MFNVYFSISLGCLMVSVFPEWEAFFESNVTKVLLNPTKHALTKTELHHFSNIVLYQNSGNPVVIT